MGRDVQSIEKEPADEAGSKPTSTQTSVEATVVVEAAVDVLLISMHYPQPTLLSRVLRDVAQWSEWSFIVSPDLDRQLQVVSPKRVDVATGMGLFQAAIESVGLRMIHLRDDVVKISKQRKDICI